MRAARVVRRTVEVTPDSTVRECVRSVGLTPEGTSVLVDGHSVPLDLPVAAGMRLTVVPTFSGG